MLLKIEPLQLKRKPPGQRTPGSREPAHGLSVGFRPVKVKIYAPLAD